MQRCGLQEEIDAVKCKTQFESLGSRLAASSCLETSPTCRHSCRILHKLGVGNAKREARNLKVLMEKLLRLKSQTSAPCFDLASSESSSFLCHGMQRLSRRLNSAQLTVSVIMFFLTQGVIDTGGNILARKPALWSYFLQQSCPTGILQNGVLIYDDSPTETLP